MNFLLFNTTSIAMAIRPLSVMKLAFVDPPDLRFATDTVETVMLTALGEAFVHACRRQ